MMMRWLAGTLGLMLVLAVTTGCNRQCFLSKEVFDEAHSHLLPPNLEEPGAGVHAPLTGAIAEPPSVSFPDRPPRYLSLQEAIAVALENGTASARLGVGAGIGAGGVYDMTLVQGVGPLQAQSDFIRVLALQPAIAGANIEAALARFDAQWITSMNWSVTDNLQQGLQSFQNGEAAQFQSALVKGLASGGVVGLTFQTDYRLLVDPPTGPFAVLNPSYTSRLFFSFEQPLLRDFGTNINQLLNRGPQITSGEGFPGRVSGLFNARNQGLLQAAQFGIGNDGILIARLRFDQQRADFERNVHSLVLQVETAYWRLYQAYGRLYSFEEVLRIAHRAWMVTQTQFEAGTKGIADLAPVRAQFEEFRGERAAALGNVLDQERNLRGLIGLPLEDGCRLIPISAPTLAPYCPDWHASLQDALHLRPELVLARESLRLAQYNLEVQRNFMQPDLRFSANYVPTGFGTRLDGRETFLDGTGTPRPANAFQSLSSSHFADWTMGLTLSMPLGFRFENAAMRAARLTLAQNFYLIKDQEQRASHFLAQQYQKVDEWNKLIDVRRTERVEYGKALDAQFKKYEVGQVTPFFLLDLQRRLATAQVKEYEAITEYNITLARFEWAKGTVLKYNNVHIAEGPLPQCTQIRAVENEMERSKAIVLRERPEPFLHPGRLASPTEAPPLHGPIHSMPSLLPEGTEPLETLPGTPRELPLELPPNLDERTPFPEQGRESGEAPIQPTSQLPAEVLGGPLTTEPQFKPASRTNLTLPTSPEPPTLPPAAPEVSSPAILPMLDDNPLPQP